MRILLICISLMMATSLWAQGPVIDSMRVNEWGRALIVRGEFGFAQGAVWCDSVELPIISWSDTLIRASIPDSGRGFAGPVVVGAKGYQSQPRMLTFLSGTAMAPMNATYLQFAIRLDIHSLLINHDNKTLRLQLKTSSHLISHLFQWQGGHFTYDQAQVNDDHIPYVSDDSSYTYGFRTTATFSLKNDSLLFEVKQISGVHAHYERYENRILVAENDIIIHMNDFKVAAILDSNFFLINTSTISQPVTLFQPTISVVYLSQTPSLISPLNNTTVNRDGLILTWKPLSQMNAYHLQCSSDSTFSTSIIDTSIPSITYSLPTLEKNTTYYWRVAGTNSEGQSRWSDRWSFTTNDILEVRSKNNVSQYTLYPNPAHDRIYITLAAEPGPASTSNIQVSITDLLGREVVQSSSVSGNSIALPLSLVPGMYLCRIGIGESMVTKRLVVE